MFNDVLLRNPIVLNPTEKKKPHNIQIKNFNPNEPKVKQNIKYTAKQNFRRYKTMREPYKLDKIMIDENDDMVFKIQEAFGIKPKAKPNFSDISTAELPNSQGLIYSHPPETKSSRNIYDDAPTSDTKFNKRRDDRVQRYTEEYIREKGEAFEYTKEILEDLVEQVMSDEPIDLLKPPEGDVPFETIYFDEPMATLTDISAKTTEIGSMTTEAEQAEAVKRGRGRPPLDSTVKKRQEEAEKKEEEQRAKEFAAAEKKKKKDKKKK